MSNDFKVFTSEQLSNAEYHDPNGWAAEYVSGSALGEIYDTCLARWKFSQKKETKALVRGTQSHTNFESEELFSKTYRRAFCADEHKDVITSQTALASKLKSFGLTGTSGKTYPDLIKMMVDCGEDLKVLWLIEMIEQCQALADGVELVPAADYDACIAMRAVLTLIPEHEACMNSPTAQRELSIMGKVFGVKVKIRIDHVDVVKNYPMPFVLENGDIEFIPTEVVVITDYKTTTSVKPEEFGKSAFNHGYLLKMALQRDLFIRAYDEKRPVIVRLLAQEKTEPYLPLAFVFKDKHIAIGRHQYQSVIKMFAKAQESNVWPSYEGGKAEVDLQIPAWAEKQFENMFK